MNTRYVVLLSHFDGSGVIQAFGPYNTRALADGAMADLQTWPAIQDGRWEVLPCAETPSGGLTTGMTIAKAVETCAACPSQWDAWTDTGQYLYLRYRGGNGTAEAFPSPDVNTWDLATDSTVASFDTGDSLHGSITLAEFCELAGLTIAEGADLR